MSIVYQGLYGQVLISGLRDRQSTCDIMLVISPPVGITNIVQTKWYRSRVCGISPSEILRLNNESFKSAEEEDVTSTGEESEREREGCGEGVNHKTGSKGKVKHASKNILARHFFHIN